MSEVLCLDMDFQTVDNLRYDSVPFDSVQILHVFEQYVQPDSSACLPHSSNNFMLIFCLGGCGEISIDQSRRELETETVVCTLKQTKSVTLLAKDTVLHCVCITFNISDKALMLPQDVTSLLNFYTGLTDALVLHEVADYRSTLSSFLAELVLVKPTVYLLKGYFYQLLVEVFRSYLKHDAAVSSESINDNAVGHTVYAIVRYIDDHLCSMDHLTKMAEELGYSYNYLSHLFRRKTSMTIQAYVTAKKIEQSKIMLVEGDYSITEIATMLNYDCIQSFSKAFRRATNMSPTEYRAIHQTI